MPGAQYFILAKKATVAKELEHEDCVAVVLKLNFLWCIYSFRSAHIFHSKLFGYVFFSSLSLIYKCLFVLLFEMEILEYLEYLALHTK